jgi:hypothetical protein
MGFAAAAFAAATMGAESCSTETTNEADIESDAQAEGESNPPKAKRPAGIGDSITVEGTDTKMKVTVVKVIDPVTAGEYQEPDAGNRYVGVQVKLRNVGDVGYDDSPSNGAELLLSNDTQAEGTLLVDGDCSSDFGSSAKIAPGSVQQGCIPFEVKGNLRPKTFQFTLDSGFGPEGGEWNFRGGR